MTATTTPSPSDHDRGGVYPIPSEFLTARRHERQRREGFPEGFARFYAETVPRLHAVLRVQGFDHHIAADAVEDAILEAGRKWPTIGNPYAWLRTTAWRRAARLKQQMHDQAGLSIESLASDRGLVLDELTVPDIADAVVSNDSADLAFALLRTLPPRQRKVMSAHLAGMDDHRIAELLGITLATVRSSRRHARANLRQKLIDRDLDV